MNTDGTTIQDKTVTGENLENEFLYFIVNTSIGEKYIFVAANMTDEQIKAVKTATDHNPEQVIKDIKEVTTNYNFVMTGQAVTEGSNSEIINIEEHKMTRIKATLTRVTSKVLVTCTTKENTGYVNLTKDNGYIKLSDVHYILETTNKKFFPFQKANNEDPNFLMSTTLQAGYEANFFTAAKDVTKGEIAIQHDVQRIEGSENPYTEGLYCLENTIDVDGEYSNDFSDPQKVATYLKVAAKFTPKNIDGITGLSEQDAKKKLSGNGTLYTCKKGTALAKEMCYSSIEKGINYLKSEYNLTVTTNDFDCLIRLQGGECTNIDNVIVVAYYSCLFTKTCRRVDKCLVILPTIFISGEVIGCDSQVVFTLQVINSLLYTAVTHFFSKCSFFTSIECSIAG